MSDKPTCIRCHYPIKKKADAATPLLLQAGLNVCSGCSQLLPRRENLRNAQGKPLIPEPWTVDFRRGDGFCRPYDFDLVIDAMRFMANKHKSEFIIAHQLYLWSPDDVLTQACLWAGTEPISRNGPPIKQKAKIK